MWGVIFADAGDVPLRNLWGLVSSVAVIIGGVILPNQGNEKNSIQSETTVVQVIAINATDVQTIDPSLQSLATPTTETVKLGPINYHGFTFKHGDVSWLPALATAAGWPEKTWPKLERIILRESGGCPNRFGGSIVNKDCEITGHDGSNHRSDTGLMQINGVNYNIERNKWAAVCTKMNICEQEPLFDPLTNLKAGKLLYDLSGWGPWDPCSWGGSTCKKKKP